MGGTRQSCSLLYKEITASSLVKINVLSKPETDYGINKSGYVIHGAIHKARPEVKCVIHSHTRAGIAIAAMKCGLLPASQTAMRFHHHIGYHDYEGPAAHLESTAHIYQPGTRRPYGMLEWHALLRLLDAEGINSGYPPYWN